IFFFLQQLQKSSPLFQNLCWLFVSHVALSQFGWGSDQGIGGFGEEPGIKAQLTNLIRSIRTVMRVPLIALNSITIVLLLLFG
uniref:Immediate early response 3-interacting protein 1 n=1 Tax=Zosterops lateralis melanops TaxID=1220523 RepID=A0A8D2PQQ8_ZOSLA